MRRRLAHLVSVSKDSPSIDLCHKRSIRILQLIFGNGEPICFIWRYIALHRWDYTIQTWFRARNAILLEG